MKQLRNKRKQAPTRTVHSFVYVNEIREFLGYVTQ